MKILKIKKNLKRYVNRKGHSKLKNYINIT